ncbi:Gfo/Idh/MocA family protein [Luethyella okanaganae]|uniref:Gfo/Idh/MocA family protein n=1 Tax=Luethyella okanaganae TaxID=69372 RepID=A0ABW1VB84_9MICO
MTTSLRWGILATGGIAHAFTKDLVLHGFVVQAVGSRSQDSADAFAAEYGIPAAYGSYETLVADPEVDIVYVSTPHPFHAEYAMLALNAGKHVLVEKSFTVNAAQARAVVTLAESKGLLVLEAMWTRFLPHMVRIREILAAGTLGEVHTLIADHTQDLPDDPAHRVNALGLGGGALLDLAIYPISFASSLFGCPETIQASATFKETGADAQVATIFRYPGGQIVSTLSASDTRGPNVATVLGTEGRIDIDSVWYCPTTFRVYDAAGAVVESFESEVVGRGMQFQAAEAERLVADGAISSDILPTSESIQIMETLDAIRAQIGLRYPGE